jgi:hypothetical protein
MKPVARAFGAIEMERSDIFSVIATGLSGIAGKEPEAVPTIGGSQILVASDYAGHYGVGDYRVLSFLAVSADAGDEWEQARSYVRAEVMKGDTRRISYKGMNDGMVRRAIGPFLNAANLLPGLSFTVAIDNRIPALLNDTVPPDLRHWKPKVFSSALHIAHFLSILVAGVSSPGQNVFWITDEDDIAANARLLADLTDVVMNISRMYLRHGMGYVKCGTTAIDGPSRQVEDFAAIPDLVVGCLSETLARNEICDVPISTEVMFPIRIKGIPKSKRILRWYTDMAIHPLKRLMCVIHPTEDEGQHSAFWPQLIPVFEMRHSPYVLAA